MATPAFGPNAALVDEILAVATAPSVVLGWDEADALATKAAAQLVAVPGEGNLEARIGARIAKLRADAEALDAPMARAIGAAAGSLEARRTVVATGVPYARAGGAMLEAALLWPAVHGAHANPFAAVAELTRADLAVIPSGDGVLLFQRGLARQATLPAAPARPSRFVIARDLGDLG